MALPVNFKDDVLAAGETLRRFQMITNSDGTVSFVDVTNYSQIGSSFGAAQMNETNAAVNGRLDADDVVDPMTATIAGFAADALKTREAIEETENKIPTTLRNPYSLTIKGNGTTLGAYNGASAQTFNITPASIGAIAKTLTNVTDWNNVTENGFYHSSGSAANLPSDTASTVLGFVIAYNSSFLVQTIYMIMGNYTFKKLSRAKINSSFTDWEIEI